jgi:hypothetical protein
LERSALFVEAVEFHCSLNGAFWVALLEHFKNESGMRDATSTVDARAKGKSYLPCGWGAFSNSGHQEKPAQSGVSSTHDGPQSYLGELSGGPN